MIDNNEDKARKVAERGRTIGTFIMVGVIVGAIGVVWWWAFFGMSAAVMVAWTVTLLIAVIVGAMFVSVWTDWKKKHPTE